MWTPISEQPVGQEENDAFQAWLLAESDVQKNMAEVTLLHLLRRHSNSIIWIKMQRNDPSLANKAIMQVWQNIHTFRGESAFSTWVHRVLTNVVNDEMREEMQRKGEQPIEESEEPAIKLDLNWRLLYDKVKKALPPEDQELMQCKLEGMTDSEIAVRFSTRRSTIEWRWGVLKEKVKMMAAF